MTATTELVVFLPDGEDLDLDDGSTKGRGSSVTSLRRIPAGPVCNGIRHDGKGYCGQPMGYLTPHLGTGRCVLHGGMAPSSMKAAAAFMADQACAQFGLPSGSSDPPTALRNALARADGMVNAVGQVLSTSGNLTATDHLGDPVRSALEQQYQTWVDQSARIAAVMARLGLDERMVRAEEGFASDVSDLMLRLLDHPSLALPYDKRMLGRQLLRGLLREMADALPATTRALPA